MESYLKSEHKAESDFKGALTTALDAWSVGHMALGPDAAKELPEKSAIVKHRQEQLGTAGVEAGILERENKAAIRYRALSDDEVRSTIGS
jgi:hypothetical protein